MRVSETFNKQARKKQNPKVRLASWALTIGAIIITPEITALFHDTFKKDGEGLTKDEIELVHSIFGDEVNTRNIKKHFHEESNDNAAAWVRAGSHRHIDFWGHRYHSKDYANENNQWNYGMFVHEMTHIWQHQSQFTTVIKAGKEAKDTRGYDYELTDTSRFDEFGVEQQASIIEDYAKIFLYEDYNRYDQSTGPHTEYRKNLIRVVEDKFPQARITRLALDKQHEERERQHSQEKGMETVKSKLYKTPKPQSFKPAV